MKSVGVPVSRDIASLARQTAEASRSRGDLEAARPEFSVLVPCFNEEDAILDTITNLREELAGCGPYELIVVNDGSTDASGELLGEVAALDPTLQVIHHPRNQGYGASLKTALRRAKAEFIVITDADGTYPNDRIPDLVERARKADMVVGARTGLNVEYPLIRKIPKSVLVRYASWMAGRRIPDINSGLRVFRRDVAERFLRILPDGFSFTTTITLAMLTSHYDVLYVPIDYAPRIGRSKIRPIRDTLQILQLILRTALYFAPLRAFAPILYSLGAIAMTRLTYDVVWGRNITDTSIMLMMFTLNAGMFALLADMIDKRGG